MFLVGAGAIGCEMLKNWAMMGVGALRGLVHLTDMDNIERSNLSRQFLFREKDVKKSKALVAARAAQEMNRELNIRAYEMRVGDDTEAHFNNEFWDSLDVVVTALDNVNARLYVDGRAMLSCKPMIDSGTLGTKGCTQVVIPRKTQNYGASRDPPEAGIPMCTLKHYPYKIEHTVQWARDWFEGSFKQLPTNINLYIKDSTAFVNSLDDGIKLMTLREVKRGITVDKPSSFQDCISWARLTFQELFCNNIKQLLYNFPADQVTSTGALFWSGTKRAPHALLFNPTDSAHLDFIVAAANLHAQTYGLTTCHRDRAIFLDHLPKVDVPLFQPKEGVKIAADDEDAKEIAGKTVEEWDVDGQAKETLSSMPSASSLKDASICSLEFEKDDDTNFHIDFITACSNLRARCYRIEEASKHKTKGLAGKIIPAIATTTALVTGLVCLELYKIILEKPMESFRNAFLNLALPFLTVSEPLPCKAVIFKEHRWTDWDHVDIKGPMLMKTFIDHIEHTYGVEIQMISYGRSILYSFFATMKKIKKRKAQKMEVVAAEVSNQPIRAGTNMLLFEVCCVDEEDEDVDVDLPVIRYFM